MNKILKLSAIALLASSTSLMAQSKNFAGASIGLSLSAVGAEISGNSTSSSGATAGTNATSGSIGKVAEIAAIDASYGFAMGTNSVFVIGATYTPGKAKAGTGNYTDNNTAADAAGASQTGTLSVEVKDPYTIYVAPTYVVGNNAALYAKLGYSKADVNVNATGGAALTAKPSDLEGWTYAIGSKTLLTNNVYVGVEASITDYDSIRATRATGVNINADAKVAQGTITLGYKF
jgi:opacity protein-like surface antigen